MPDADTSFDELIARCQPAIAELLTAIKDAPSPDKQRLAVAKALLIWGAGAVSILQKVPGLSPDASPVEVLLCLLRGEIQTGRADELSRRVGICRQVLDAPGGSPPDLLRSIAAEGLLQIAATRESIVKNEEREHAFDWLIDTARKASLIGEHELELHCLCSLIIYDGLTKEVLPETLARVSALRELQTNPTFQADALFAELTGLLRSEQTPEVLDTISRISESAARCGLGADDGRFALLCAAAVALRCADRRDAADRIYRKVLADSSATRSPTLWFRAEAAIPLASSLVEAGDVAGAVVIVEPLLEFLEKEYVEAVTSEDLRKAEDRLASTGELLFEAYARLQDWRASFCLVDRLKALRTRHRRALRRLLGGRELMMLERKLFVARRGVTKPLGNPRQDMFAEQVPAEDTLDEEIRQRRHGACVERRVWTSPKELGKYLEPHEAVLAVGVGQRRTVAFMVGHATARSVRVEHWDLAEWSIERWRRVLDDWLVRLIIGMPEGRILRAVLRAADSALGRPASEVVAAWDIHRLYVVPHRDLASIPFWALPSLHGTDVVMADSVAGLADALAEPLRSIGRVATVVADPTGDLPIARLQAVQVTDILAREGFATAALEGKNATRPNVLQAVSRANLVHFAGHGRRDVLRAQSSALLVASRPNPMWLHVGPLLSLLNKWQPEADGGRSQVVPNVGRITEWREGDRVDRLAETTIETFFGSWVGDQVRFASELLTADELAVTPGLDRCAVAVLMACETGPFYSGGFVHEPRGLVEALQLAGARTIVATGWPVREVSTLVLTELLYAELFNERGAADMGRALRRSVDHLRRMSREAAAERLETLAARFQRGDAFRLRALAYHIANGPRRPFADPVCWASFHVVGAPRVSLDKLHAGHGETGAS